MTIKSRFILIIFVALLTACGQVAPQAAEMTKVQNTALAMAQTGVALTQTALSTLTLPPPTITSTALPTPTTTPSPEPTQPPPPILTPDAIQVVRWKEYQTALADVVMVHEGGYALGILCEWDILGRSGQKLYVWAYCAGRGGGGGSTFAVIYLASDGSIQKVSTASRDTPASELFPEDVRAKSDLYDSLYGRSRDLLDHLLYSDTHPDEPPLVVLSAISTATPLP